MTGGGVWGKGKTLIERARRVLSGKHALWKGVLARKNAFWLDTVNKRFIVKRRETNQGKSFWKEQGIDGRRQKQEKEVIGLVL